MLDVNQKELQEYFAYASKNEAPWTPESSQEMVTAMYNVFAESDFMEKFLMPAYRIGMARFNAESALATIFTFGFNMGREYQDRHQTADELERLLKKNTDESH